MNNFYIDLAKGVKPDGAFALFKKRLFIVTTKNSRFTFGLMSYCLFIAGGASLHHLLHHCIFEEIRLFSFKNMVCCIANRL